MKFDRTRSGVARVWAAGVRQTEEDDYSFSVMLLASHVSRQALTIKGKIKIMEVEEGRVDKIMSIRVELERDLKPESKSYFIGRLTIFTRYIC